MKNVFPRFTTFCALIGCLSFGTVLADGRGAVPETESQHLSNMEEMIEQLDSEKRELLNQFNKSNKLRLARLFKKAAKESGKKDIPLAESFFQQTSKKKDYQFLNAAQEKGLLKTYSCTTKESYDMGSGHLLVAGQLEFSCDDSSQILILGIGPGISVVPKEQFRGLFLCAGEDYFGGVGVDAAAGFIRGVGFGAWVGTGVCMYVGAGKIYGAYARMGFLAIK